MGVLMNRKITAMLVVAVFLLVGGCSEKSQSILSPVDSPPALTSVQPGANTKAEAPTPLASIKPGSNVNCGVTLLPLPLPLWGDSPGASSTSYITRSSGGKVSVSYSYYSILRKQVRISATLTVPAGAVDKDTYITMSLDDKYVAVNFKPSGLKFNMPAKLDFNATGLDLSVVPIGVPISLYFVDFLTVEKEKAGSITANRFYGSLVCSNGEIPHFSRYAFGY